LSEEVSFLNKGSLISALNRIPNNSKVIIDGSKSVIIDYDVLEVIENFKTNAKERDIEVETIAIKEVKTASVH
jgi:MFS superfamily sulfate permease-like transporter